MTEFSKFSNKFRKFSKLRISLFTFISQHWHYINDAMRMRIALDLKADDSAVQ